MKLRHLLVGLLVLGMLLAGLALVCSGLATGPPEATPTPPGTVRVEAHEARRLAASEAGVPPLAIPEGFDPGRYVRTQPVAEPVAEPVDGPGTGPSTAPGVSSVADAGPPRAGEAVAWVDRVQIPSIYVDALLEEHGLTPGNAMSLPENLSRVGRLSTTRSLHAAAGSTLLAGHVTWNGENAALYYLGAVRPGASVRTWDGAGRRIDWAVTSVELFGKQALPDEIFAGDGPRRLVLVTCGGPLVRRADGTWSYEQNIVVTAVPMDPVTTG